MRYKNSARRSGGMVGEGRQTADQKRQAFIDAGLDDGSLVMMGHPSGRVVPVDNEPGTIKKFNGMGYALMELKEETVRVAVPMTGEPPATKRKRAKDASAEGEG